MKQLTLKDIAPYLPYSIKAMHHDRHIEIVGLREVNLNHEALFKLVSGSVLGWWTIDEFKPLLRPLSSLTREIEHNGEGFVPMVNMYDVDRVVETEVFAKSFKTCELVSAGEAFPSDVLSLPYAFISKLFEWHFDVFNLIPSGLAIAIED